MEALTAASVAALTVYDMVKGDRARRADRVGHAAREVGRQVRRVAPVTAAACPDSACGELRLTVHLTAETILSNEEVARRLDGSRRRARTRRHGRAGTDAHAVRPLRRHRRQSYVCVARRSCSGVCNGSCMRHSGTTIITPGDGSGDISLNGRLPGELDFGGAAATVRVERVGSDGTVRDCVESLDVSDVSGVLMVFAHRHAGGATAFIGPLPVSHCATPLVDDLARQRLTARFVASRPVNIDLRQRVAFTSGPYTGELTSTLTTRPDPSSLSSSSSGGSSGTSPPTHRERFAYVAMRYRATFGGARPNVSYFGGSSGVCVLFDSCSVSGATTISIPAATFTFRVTASRVVRRPLGRARTLADLAAGRLMVDAELFASRKLRGTMTTQSTRSGSTDCETTRRGLPLTVSVDGYGGGRGAAARLILRSTTRAIRTMRSVRTAPDRRPRTSWAIDMRASCSQAPCHSRTSVRRG